MAINKIWEINELERDLSDGYVKKIIYRLKAIDDSDNKEVQDTRITGEVTFTKPSSLPSDFKSYDSLDAATCIGWLKAALDTDGVAEIEAAMDANLAPATTGLGTPW
jgi:hypothetical protein